MRPSISVVMSVYNGELYIKDAVNSILNQSYKNFEFIIINDASTDKTADFLNSLKDKRIVLLQNKKNLGLAASLNKGINKSSGEYIARMDADDISKPKRFEKQLNFMKKHPDIDILGTWTALIGKNNQKIGFVHYPTSDINIKKTLRRVTPIVHPTWLTKALVFKKLKGYKQKWDYVEDYEFLLRAKKFKMANIPEELVLWRNQDSRRSKKNIQIIYRKGLQLRIAYFMSGHLDIFYLPYLIRSMIATFLFPPSLKVYLNKKAGNL